MGACDEVDALPVQSVMCTLRARLDDAHDESPPPWRALLLISTSHISEQLNGPTAEFQYRRDC